MTSTLENKTGGYDSPVTEQKEDFFDRWRFAFELWQILGNAPKDWSVRLGIYGRWGEGKTSVLKFLEHFAKRDSNIVVWFNPWSIRNREDLWNCFAGTIFSRLEEEGIRVEGSGAVKVKKAGRLLVDPIQKLAELNQTTKVVVGGTLSLFGKFLNVDSETFKNIRKALAERRVIVIIDDLDRANPQLLPEILLSLREVLDLPNFSFVLAFDVHIVARALAEEYKAWGRGEEFLEKVIDFPIALPIPSEWQIKNFLFSELDRYCPFAQRQVFEQLFCLLPKNPRKLKLFIRYIWTLGHQISRHDDWELDWATLVISQLLKIESTTFCRALVEDDKLVEMLWMWRYKSISKQGETDTNERAVLVNYLDELLEKIEIPKNDPRVPRIKLLVEALGEKSNVNGPDHLRYHFYLVDRPHAITWKEFDMAFEGWLTTRSVETVNKWLVKHSEAVAAQTNNSAQELFDTAVTFRLRKLDDAAGALGAEDQAKCVRLAEDALQLVEALIEKGLKTVGTGFYRTAKHFDAVWAMVQKWIHFDKNQSDKEARKREREVLFRFVKHASRDPIAFFEVIKPWVSDHSPLGDQERLAHELRGQLAAEVEPLVADNLIIRLRDKGTISNLWGHDQHLTEKWVLFRDGSAIWQSERRKRMLETLRQAGNDPAIHSNAVELIHLISHGLQEGLGFAYGSQKLAKLLEDKEITISLWNAATARPLQFRSLSRMREIRKQFGSTCGTPEELALPEWLEEKI